MKITYKVICQSLALSILLFGCAANNSSQPPKSIAKAASNMRAAVANARSNVQWTGTYQGIFPCAGCEGVATMLKLNPDMTYSLRTRQLGVEDIDRKSDGRFSWQRDNSHIVLQGKTQNRIFRVGDGFLQLTGADGKPVQSPNPDAFYLEKTD